jgi:predicted phosphohydrolase
MKLQYASDLHLELAENKEFLRVHPIKPEGDILLLAGDIVPFRLMDRHADFFDYLSDNFKITYWIPGNHEYYHSEINERSGYLTEKIRDNVFLVNNTSVEIGNLNVIFSTLWTNISPANQYEIKLGYSDFHAIMDNGVMLNISQYNIMHNQCLTFLKGEFVSNKSGKMIVVTHHLPTFINYPAEFSGSAFNDAFAVELSDLIIDAEPDYWIFGHQHINRNDFKIGQTRMTSNPLGYVMFDEQKGFDEKRFILI